MRQLRSLISPSFLSCLMSFLAVTHQPKVNHSRALSAEPPPPRHSHPQMSNCHKTVLDQTFIVQPMGLRLFSLVFLTSLSCPYDPKLKIHIRNWEIGHSLLYQPCALNYKEDLGNFFCASKYKEHWWNLTVFHHCALEQKRCQSELGPEKELIKCKSPLLLMKSCPTLLDKHIMSLAC